MLWGKWFKPFLKRSNRVRDTNATVGARKWSGWFAVYMEKVMKVLRTGIACHRDMNPALSMLVRFNIVSSFFLKSLILLMKDDSQAYSLITYRIFNDKFNYFIQNMEKLHKSQIYPIVKRIVGFLGKWFKLDIPTSTLMLIWPADDEYCSWRNFLLHLSKRLMSKLWTNLYGI